MLPTYTTRTAKWLYMIGRVKPGVSQRQLQAKLSGLLRQALAPIRTYSSAEEKGKVADCAPGA